MLATSFRTGPATNWPLTLSAKDYARSALSLEVVIGGGPAGMGLLLAARRAGLLNDLVAAELKIIERTDLPGPGALRDYAIHSDSVAEMFLRSVDVEGDPPLHRLMKISAGRQLDAARGDSVGLSIVADFYAEVADELRRQLQPADPFVTGLEATRAVRQHDGTWLTICRRGTGK